MGLLDDAIREHLDLKRRRGADPAEIERSELEALGPVRRDPIASEDAPPGFEPGTSEDAPAVAESRPPAEHPSSSHGGGQPADERPLDDAQDWDDYYEDEYEDEEEFDPGVAVHPAAPSPEAHPDEPPVPSDPDDALGNTISYDIEQEQEPSQPDQPQEDVLEETPEFLQDTPDHDRLWFEQRPPRDFDFDE